MGQRGVDREPATAEDLAKMRELAKEAIEVGALGFASSRLTIHKTESGSPIPSYDAAREEIEEIARGVVDGGGGLLQFVPDIPSGGYQPVLQTVFDVAEDVGLPVTFTLVVGNAGDPTWPDAITMIEKANAAGGDVTAQLLPRPIGLIIGLELTANPFVLYPSYREIAHLPLAERVAEMRKPEVRARILADKPGHGHPILYVAQMWDWIFPLDDNPGLRARPVDQHRRPGPRQGAEPMAEAYDRLLDAMAGRCCWSPSATRRTLLDTVRELLATRRRGDGPRRRRGALRHDLRRQLLDVRAGALGARPEGGPIHLGRSGRRTRRRAGAHRRAGRPREHRGRLQGRHRRHRPRGIALHKPEISDDLPAGGRRLDPTADGYARPWCRGR